MRCCRRITPLPRPMRASTAFLSRWIPPVTQSITATDTAARALQAQEPGIAVQAATARTLAITGFPATDTAGQRVDVTVTAYDAYGNVATGYTGTVSLTSSDPHAVLPSELHVQFDPMRATHSFSVTLDTSGTQSITATDTSDLEPHGHRVGDRGAGGGGEDAVGHRLPHQRHRGHDGMM